MNFKNLFNQLFAYTPQKKYEFNIPNNNEFQVQEKFDESTSNEEKNIYPTLSVNEEYMKIRYNLLINSDIILRNFTLNARGKQYNAFLVYIDGMVDSQILDDFILKPLMLRNKSNSFDGNENKVISEAVTNNITVRKVKKFNLPSYILGCLMPQNQVTTESTFDKIITGINSRKLCFICRYFKCCF